MFKIFGLWDKRDWENDNNINPEMETEVEISEINDTRNETLEEETGQIALDVLETDTEIIIISPIAWVEYDDIDLTLNKTVLTIKWVRQKPKEYFIWDIKIKNKECFWGKFIRNVILPENLEMNKIKAYMDTNLLIIKIPKLQFDSKTIKIDKVTI